MKVGDWVEVKDSYDIPGIFRGYKPTRGRIEELDGDTVMIAVPIGGADVDEHSQAVPYPREALEPVND